MICSTIPNDLGDYFDRIYRTKKLLGKSERTAKIYTETFARFAEYLQHNPTLEDLTEDKICGFMDWRLSAGRAYHTVDKEADKLIAITNYAARKRHIEAFVDRPNLDPPESMPTCWTREQLATLLEACRMAKGKFGDAPRAIWWLAFHCLCLATGERTEAMLMLRWDMLKGDYLSVPPSIRKGRRKAARYRLPANVVAILKQLRPYTKGKIFAAPWKNIGNSFYKHYTGLLRSAGLPEGRDFKPQKLRQTFASFLEAAGGDATEALGHVDRRVTKQSYLDTSITEADKESPSIVVWRKLGF
jgi:integrase